MFICLLLVNIENVNEYKITIIQNIFFTEFPMQILPRCNGF